MAEMKFNCPQCGQAIACDELWGGHAIQCPICSKEIMVPTPAAAPVVAAAAAGSAGSLVPKVPGGTKLSFSSAVHKPATPPPSQTISRAAAAFVQQKKAKPDWLRYVYIAGGLAALAVAVVIAWPYVKKWQDKTSASQGDSTVAGEAGHIANLNKVLDETEPGRVPSGGVMGNSLRNARRASAQRNAMDPETEAGKVGSTMAYSLDPTSVTIPNSKVSGTISGGAFVAETIRLDASAGNMVLRFFKGDMRAPDREILVYLKPKAAAGIAGEKLLITPDMKGAGVPNVAKRWKADPRYAPRLQSYSTGYAMKLELGDMAAGSIPGKIYVALPDAEKSVIAGAFTVTSSGAPATAAPVAAQPQKTPVAATVSAPERYGVAQ
jgi:DNA-directed RNA polymerase subunit RPC12/RpoP